jgi:hypothetical protein
MWAEQWDGGLVVCPFCNQPANKRFHFLGIGKYTVIAHCNHCRYIWCSLTPEGEFAFIDHEQDKTS